MQPVEFAAGQGVGYGGIKAPDGDSAGGLFSGASGPKPPPALSQAVIGMKAGGKVSAALPICAAMLQPNESVLSVNQPLAQAVK